MSGVAETRRPERRAVELLAPEVSRRIAAGEVIERPASVVRELVDNSLDAGADSIDVSWRAGGSELIRVHDTGVGMDAHDLDLCWRPHATSKIRALEDLARSRSLGFRGEALASVSAVSELEIVSSTRAAARGHRLVVRNAERVELAPAAPRLGTTIEVRRLFANLPARRRFLSRPQAESAAIRNSINDKALPFPSVAFRHGAEEGTTRSLPAQSQLERVADVFGNPVPAHSLHEIHGGGEGFAITAVAAEPAIVRRDRRLIQVFVNRRRVWEYKLVQAVEYAYQDVQHGGLFPAAAILVDLDPALADFNIHPAKREVRLRNAGELHHRLVELLRSFLRAWTVKSVHVNRELWGDAAHAPPADKSGRENRDRSVRPSPPGPHERGAAERPSAPYEPPVRGVPAGRPHPTGAAQRPPAAFEPTVRAVPGADDLVYRGALFGMFLVVERGERAWIIDQHAAHERLLYDRFRAARSSQQLLVPEEFETSEDQDAALRAHASEYAEIGIVLERHAPRRWVLHAMPTEYRENTEDLIETILELGGLNEALDRTFVAEMACKAALKAGDYLDGLSALELAERTLALPEPRCPHGRPLYLELTQDNLERWIGRKK